MDNAISPPKFSTPLEEKYRNLTQVQQQLFKQFVADVLGKASRNTMHTWLKGISSPSRAEKFLIAEHLECDVNLIFPPKK